MATLKKGARVIANTVTGKNGGPGKITEVRQGPKGAWYSVKLEDGRVINTRGACIKLV